MRITVADILDMKARGHRIAMLTAYDYPTARLLDEAGIPMILVGDSLGMVVLGYDSTIPVTLDDIIRHTQAVVRGTKKALVVADMPFMTFQLSPTEALRNAGTLIQQGGAQAVKLEGGLPMAETVRRLVDCGIPVMGHIGLTPQAVHQLGGYKVQGRTPEAARRLLEDAQALEQAGAFSLVLELVPSPLAHVITGRLTIPTIGIGAGLHCDGQVQVVSDLLGLFVDFVPKHVKQYARLADIVKDAAARYLEEVAAGTFPTSKESFTMDEKALADLAGSVGARDVGAGRARSMDRGGTGGRTISVSGAEKTSSRPAQPPAVQPTKAEGQ